MLAQSNAQTNTQSNATAMTRLRPIGAGAIRAERFTVRIHAIEQGDFTEAGTEARPGQGAGQRLCVGLVEAASGL